MAYFMTTQKITQEIIDTVKMQPKERQLELIIRKINEGTWKKDEVFSYGLLTLEEWEKYQVEQDRKIDITEHITNIKNGKYLNNGQGTYSKDRVNMLLSNGILNENQFFMGIRQGLKANNYSKDSLTAFEIITENEYEYNIVTKDEHLDDIRQNKISIKKGINSILENQKESTNGEKNENGNLRKIRILVTKKIITEKDLLECGLSTDEISLLLNGSLPPFVPNLLTIDDIPDIVKNRTDIFVLGIQQSGKSCLMAGLFYYAESNGLSILETDVKYTASRDYYELLNRSIEEHRLIKGNKKEDFQYMNVDFIVNDSKHKLTFFEMGGELFEELHNLNQEKYHAKIKSHLLNSNNPKILFFIIDFDTEQFSSSSLLVRTKTRFIYILDFFKTNDLIKDIDAIFIVITKWDLAEKMNKGLLVEKKLTKEDFVNKRYPDLIAKIEDIKKLKPKGETLESKILTFSLGEFNEANTIYKYESADSKNIFKHICNVSRSSLSNNSVKKKWF